MIAAKGSGMLSVMLYKEYNESSVTYRSGRHVPLIECLHDVMYMKCVFVCVVYLYTCESNSLESQAKSLASLTRLGLPLAWMEVMAVQLSQLYAGYRHPKKSNLHPIKRVRDYQISKAMPIVNLQKSPNCLNILLI